MKYFVLAFALIAGQQASAEARDARVMWAAFSCFELARLADGPQGDKAGHLFEVGYASGGKVLKAVRSGSISEADFQSEVPLNVSLLLDGPTDDFIIGRIFEIATGSAHEQVTRKEHNGWLLPVNEWVRDTELISIIAGGQFNRANCDLL